MHYLYDEMTHNDSIIYNNFALSCVFITRKAHDAQLLAHA